MVVPGGILGSAVQTLRWNGVPATRHWIAQAIEVALEIARQRRPQLARATRVPQDHRPILQPQQSFMRGS